jgi:hypothetical protein
MGAGVFAFALSIFLLATGSSSAAEPDSKECESAARKIAATYGSGEFGNSLSPEFPEREAVLAALEQARKQRTPVNLRVLSIDSARVQSTAAGRICVAQLRFQVEVAKKPAGAPGAATWRILLPESARPQKEPAPDQWLVGTHRGRAMLRVFWKLGPGDREKVLAEPTAAEDGLKPAADDPSMLVFPDQPASGWYVRIGDQQTMTSDDGRFAVTLTDKGPAEGEIVNPGTGVVFAKFPTSNLVLAGKGDPQPVIVEAVTFGECGMDGNAAHDPACHQLKDGQP